MAKYTGVTQTEDGAWQYRLKIKTEDGLIDTKIRKDLDGLPFLTARSAYEAREAHRVRIIQKPVETPPEPPKTLLRDIYAHYQQTEAKGKAAATIRKQESMWKNYVESALGDRELESITISDLDSFLASVYRGHAYAYVEGFLRFFYLLFGHADRMNAINADQYYKMFVNKNSRLSMPKMKQLDYEEKEKGVEVYNDYELIQLTKIFDNFECNVRIAYYLGLYCGLRISECFALRWSCVDWDKRTLRIDRQQHYIDGTIRLCEVKTLKGVRSVLLPEPLYSDLMLAYDTQETYKKRLGNAYRATERVYDEVTNTWITGGDFVNRKLNGELLTVNSMKYWTRKVKEETGIEFKYHTLRHTFASRLALRNCPLNMLMELMGHLKIDTTKKYYLNSDNEYARTYTTQLIESMYQLEDPLKITVIDDEEE